MEEKKESEELDPMILIAQLTNVFERFNEHFKKFNEHFSDFNDIIAPITGKRVVKEGKQSG